MNKITFKSLGKIFRPVIGQIFYNLQFFCMLYTLFSAGYYSARFNYIKIILNFEVIRADLIFINAYVYIYVCIRLILFTQLTMNIIQYYLINYLGSHEGGDDELDPDMV